MITVYNDSYQSYFFGEEHPFNPIRYRMVLDLIAQLGHEVQLHKPATLSEDMLQQIHESNYVEAVQDPGGTDSLHAFGFSAGDTPPFKGMHEAASTMAGGTVAGARCIASGEATHVLQLGGGLHHAHASRASGFCIYNDLALAIHELLQTFGRVAYIDIDVHHGDGVQSIFYDHPDVMTISLHESGQYLYPGTGFPYEMGEAAGEGLKLNVPLEPRTSDTSYISIVEKVVPHALNWFHPDVLVVQCGADAHRDDPLAHLELTTHGYQQIFENLIHLADKHTEGRLLCTLGGGYNFGTTSRIWTMLYLMLSGKPLPDQLPDGWMRSWGEQVPSANFHDDAAARTSTPRDAAKKNDERSRQLMNRAARAWRL